MSTTQDLKDAATTLTEAFDRFRELRQMMGLLRSPQEEQLELAVAYMCINVGFATDASYQEVLSEGDSQLPLKTDGDCVWSVKEG